MITKSKDIGSLFESLIRLNTELAAPTLVASTTLESFKISPTTFSSLDRISFLSDFISRYATRFSDGRDFALDSVFRYSFSSDRQSLTISVPSDACTKDSREYFWMPCWMRAGWPNRTAFILLFTLDFFDAPFRLLVSDDCFSFSRLITRSRTLSTATLLGAATRTRQPLRCTAQRINSATVVVLPVPGGPCIKVMGEFECKAITTASL
mmetsp:Transcript_14944/g.32584  ORF Transcript_14944/g.32584 Transcript_14944/m.32584 type:complete len:209 (+) Transcript_14944:241-867(+)